MKIHLVSAVGTGTTELGAFDNALNQMGVLNYNLVRLSSVIPPGSEIVLPEKYQTPENEYGDRLYCVYAEIRSSTPGQALGSAVGWYQLEDGRGIFVEHETVGANEKEVTEYLVTECKNTLRDCIKNRGLPLVEENLHVHYKVAVVTQHPVCTFVVAAYKSERW